MSYALFICRARNEWDAFNVIPPADFDNTEGKALEFFKVLAKYLTVIIFGCSVFLGAIASQVKWFLDRLSPLNESFCFVHHYFSVISDLIVYLPSAYLIISKIFNMSLSQFLSN